MTDPSLLLRASALPGVLDGYVGFALSADGLTPVILLPGEPGDGLGGRLSIGSRWAWWPMLGRAGAIPEDWIRLPVDRPEVADHVARWVAARVAGKPVSGGYSFWFDGGYPTADRVWRLSRPNSPCAAFMEPGRPRRPFMPDHGVLIEVPALSALDPADDTRTPSGARRVDLMALRLVAERVGQGPVRTPVQNRDGIAS